MIRPPPRSTRTDTHVPCTARFRSLAMVSAVIVECASGRFAIPQLSVVELVRASAHTEHTIERINGTPVLRLRNRLLPLVNLRHLLTLDDTSGTALRSGAKDRAGHKAAEEIGRTSGRESVS